MERDVDGRERETAGDERDAHHERGLRNGDQTRLVGLDVAA